MKKLMFILGLSMAVTNLAVAHGVEIESAEKVVIKTGMSPKEKLKLMKCMLILKKHDNKEEAIKAKMAMIDEKCAKKNLDAEKCHHIKKKVAMKIAHCFTVGEFFKEFFKK